jgi:Kef-type K+ transport system membrane component KefB
MAIDGRDLVRPPVEKDPYQSRGLGIVSALVVLVPAAMVVALVFYVGSWMGGWLWGGVGSLVSTAITVLVLWAMKRRRR